MQWARCRRFFVFANAVDGLLWRVTMQRGVDQMCECGETITLPWHDRGMIAICPCGRQSRVPGTKAQSFQAWLYRHRVLMVLMALFLLLDIFVIVAVLLCQ